MPSMTSERVPANLRRRTSQSMLSGLTRVLGKTFSSSLIPRLGGGLSSNRTDHGTFIGDRIYLQPHREFMIL